MRSTLKTSAALLVTGWFLFAGVSTAQACHGWLRCAKHSHRTLRQVDYGYHYVYSPVPAYVANYSQPSVVHCDPPTKKSDSNDDSKQIEVIVTSDQQQSRKLEERLAAIERRLDEQSKSKDQLQEIEKRLTKLEEHQVNHSGQFEKIMAKLDALEANQKKK